MADYSELQTPRPGHFTLPPSDVTVYSSRSLPSLQSKTTWEGGREGQGLSDVAKGRVKGTMAPSWAITFAL